jgi:hypothetical protein
MNLKPKNTVLEVRSSVLQLKVPVEGTSERIHGMSGEKTCDRQPLPTLGIPAPQDGAKRVFANQLC